MLQKMILGCLLFVVGVFSGMTPVQAQNELPPLPLDLETGIVLFPDVAHTGSLAPGEAVTYVLLANEGELIDVTMSRLDGDLIPFLEVRPFPESEPLARQPATNLTGDAARLRLSAPATGWYYLIVSSDPAAGDTQAGSYDLTLTGTTTAIYAIVTNQTAQSTPAVVGTQAAGIGSVLGDFVTLTPSPTITPFPTTTPTVTFTPTLTPTATEAPLVPAVMTIVYTCYVNNIDQLCLMNGDGSNQLQLTTFRATTWYASLSDDRIYYSSLKSGGFELHAINIDGTGDMQITQNANAFAPAVSPDGQRIVFAAEQGSDQDIFTIHINGGDQRRLTSGGGEDLDPVWSPDGSQILFSSDRSGQRNLYIMNADGSNVRQLTTTGSLGRSDWSPDGRTIAYYAGPRGGEAIFLINSDGSNQRQLTDGRGDKAPSFSPDGNWIVFASRRDPDGDNEIFIIRTDGTELTQLTFNQRPDYQPRWGN